MDPPGEGSFPRPHPAPSINRMRLQSIRLAGAAILAMSIPGFAHSQDFDQTTCDEFRVPPRVVAGKQVGPASCMMQETDVTLDGRTFRRLDMGLDGTVEGVLATGRQGRGYFTNAADLVFPQIGAPGPFRPAIAAYSRARGASMTVFYPLASSGWNGKMWVTAHGGDVSFGGGQLRPWQRNLDRKDPVKDLSAYERLILSKGYALVKTRRPTVPDPVDPFAPLEEGTIADHVGFRDTARYIMDLTAVAERAIATRLGKPPTRTYFYGHSSGASIGRALNYSPGLNIAPDGSPVFDGVLADDAAGGAWLPRLLTDGKDSLLTSDADRARFVPQIDLVHQMHNAVWREQKADDLSPSALANARTNLALLREKGLSGKSRTYEVRSLSHEAGEVPARDPATSAIEMVWLMGSLIDHLDAWVDRGVAPPATRSDAAKRAEPAGGESHEEAISLPEVACPLGVYHAYPGPTSPRTAFAAFGSGELEPLDATGFVDMNGNGVRDRRETVTQAWQRFGLLKRGEELTTQAYVSCVRASAEGLQKATFFSDAAVRSYVDQAMKVRLPAETKQP